MTRERNTASISEGISLVLSGGGARGFAHVGVWRALQESRVPVRAVSGTSAGAIAGAFIAAGVSWKDAFEWMRNSRYFGWRNFLWRKDGLFSLEPLEKILQQQLPARFEDLSIPFFATATDLVKGEAVHFNSGKLSDALLASAAVPLVFEPQRRNGQLLVDGGVMNNFPIEPLLDLPYPIFGVHVNRITSRASGEDWGKWYLAEKCFHLAIAGELPRKTGHCRWFIEPAGDVYQMFDFEQAEEILETGYRAASELLQRELSA